MKGVISSRKKHVSISPTREVDMKYLTLLILLFSLSAIAQDKEGDLALPVSDLEIQEQQEEELPPTLEEVPIKQSDRKEQVKGKTSQPDLKRRKSR